MKSYTNGLVGHLRHSAANDAWILLRNLERDESDPAPMQLCESSWDGCSSSLDTSARNRGSLRWCGRPADMCPVVSHVLPMPVTTHPDVKVSCEPRLFIGSGCNATDRRRVVASQQTIMDVVLQ